jgi:GntR family transcriptional regulator
MVPKIQSIAMWQQVAGYLRQQILAGEYGPGQTLPSEDDLSAEFGVSRPTVNRGIQALRNEGLVTVSRQDGTRVRDPFAAPALTETRTLTAADSGEGEGDGPQWIDGELSSPRNEEATRVQADLLQRPMPLALLVRDVIQTAEDPSTGNSGNGRAARGGNAAGNAAGDGLRRQVRLMVPMRVAADYKVPWQGPPWLPAAAEVFAWFAGKGTLKITDHVRARMPLGEESTRLAVPSGTPLLVVTRVATLDGQPVAAEETTTAASALSYAYPVAYPVARPGAATGARKTSRRR